MKIFISHQRNDNRIVERVIEIFQKYGIKYWVDLEILYPEIENFKVKIREGMKECILIFF